MQQSIAEGPQMNAFFGVQEYYKSTDEVVCIFHNCKFGNFESLMTDDSEHFNEKDFIIVNFTHKYIMGIEVLKNLTEETVNTLLSQLKVRK